MNATQIKAMQTKLGVTPDGFWGPRSIKVCQDYLRQLMPTPNPWPKSDTASMTKFYGKVGEEANLVSVTFPFPVYYGTKKVTTTRVHKRCADSLVRVFNDIQARYGKNEAIMSVARSFDGVFNFRKKRGGSSYSIHSWGAAIDIDAGNNAFKDSWPLNSTMPLEIMECFAREGWVSGGAFWGYDAMHFQATL